MTFYAFMVSNYFGEDSPKGDLAHDMVEDKTFPKNEKSSYQKIEWYLKNRHACSECLKTFKSCWRRYEKSEK